MTQVIRSNERYSQDAGWLQSSWHFSFADYHDPDNMNFGPLRVFNDDVIQPGQGFGMHPHKDMEIITYVIDGQLEHQDRLGNRGLVHPGEVQVMSAGRGITHAEYNASKTDPVHLMQLWIIPRHRNNEPRWEQHRYAPAEREGRLLPVVTSTEGNGTLKIDQDATIYVSSLKSGQAVDHKTTEGRLTYVFVIKGGLDLGKDLALSAGDQARIDDRSSFNIRATADAEFMLIDLPAL